MAVEHVLDPDFYMTDAERQLALAVLTEHKIRKDEMVRIERPADGTYVDDRDDRGRYARQFQIRGGAFDIMVTYNKSGSRSNISWHADGDD